MERKRRAFLILSLSLCTAQAGAYKESTHSDISKRAIERSDVNDSSSRVLTSLGMTDSVRDKRAVANLLMQGARDEDDGTRPANHFFDPQRSGVGLPTYEPSPTWALQSQDDEQTSALDDAREYLRTTFFGPTELQRATALAQVFKSLGHVIHHVQDMHQPQHVRGDFHCDDSPFFFGWFLPNGCKTPILADVLYRPSAYEQYVWERGLLPLTGYPTADYATFDGARKFWENHGKGGAEFTSNNFVSAATNFRLDASTTPLTIRSHSGHPFPRGPDAGLLEVDINDPELIRRVTNPAPMSGEISLVATPINDAYDPRFNGTNTRASVLSIWYEPLAAGRITAPVVGFSLNSVNYEAAADQLLPRAAAYSTGLINYFFRGRIGIALPEEGVYGVLDHATTYAAGQGFAKLKLKLSNASPDGVKPSGESVPQTMQGGTLVAIAKYTLNGCYQPDLSGDYSGRFDTGQVFPPANCSFEQYLAGEEQISQSAAQLAVSLDKAAAEFTFDFSSQPIPVNARDLRIQVVYTGQLGAEADGIAFGGRDISEPTHLVVYNNSDYFLLDGRFYTPAQIRSDPALAQKVAGVDIDARPLATVSMSVVNGKPIVGPSGAIPVNGYTRVAVLADRDTPINLDVLSRFEGGGFSVASFAGIPPTVIDLRGDDAFITAYGIFRGPRGNFFDVVFKANSDAPILDDGLTVMSGRMLADPGPMPIPVRF